MSAKAKLARYFRRATGTHLNPLMSGAIACGTIVDIDHNGDVDFLGSLNAFQIEAPELQTTQAVFPKFKETRETKFEGEIRASLADAIPLNGALRAEIESAANVAVEFSDQVETQYLDIIAFSRAIAKRKQALEDEGPAEERRSLRKFLRPEFGNRVVGAVYSGRIRIHAEFAGTGTVGFKLEAYDVVSAGAQVAWVRTSAQTLEVNTPVPFAFDAWVWRQGRLRDLD